MILFYLALAIYRDILNFQAGEGMLERAAQLDLQLYTAYRDLEEFYLSLPAKGFNEQEIGIMIKATIEMNK